LEGEDEFFDSDVVAAFLRLLAVGSEGGVVEGFGEGAIAEIIFFLLSQEGLSDLDFGLDGGVAGTEKEDERGERADEFLGKHKAEER
jgi:hypothetical protein